MFCSLQKIFFSLHPRTFLWYILLPLNHGLLHNGILKTLYCEESPKYTKVVSIIDTHVPRTSPNNQWSTLPHLHTHLLTPFYYYFETDLLIIFFSFFLVKCTQHEIYHSNHLQMYNSLALSIQCCASITSI